MSSGKIHYGVALDNSELRSGAVQSRQILHSIGQTAEQEGQTIDSVYKKIASATAGIFAVSKIKDFSIQIAKVRGEFQQLEIAFKTMLGNAEQADVLMQQLTKTAMITPFGMSDIAKAAKQLLAYGVEANKVNETLIRLGDISAGLSLPIGDLAYLYGTTMTQGRLFTQDLRQFMGRGIPLADELAKQFGVTKEKVGELVTAGKVGFPEVKKAIEAMTNEGSKFGGLMEAQSKTITGQWSNIEDAIEQMFNKIGKSSEGLISNSLDVISTVIDKWQEIAKVLGVAISIYGTYKAAVIAVNAAMTIHKAIMTEVALQTKLAAMSGITLSNAEALAAARTTLFSAAMNTLKVAIMTNPIGLLAGVLAGVASAFMLFSDDASEAAQMSTKFGESASNSITRVNTLSTILHGLSDKQKSLTVSTATQKKSLDELNSILEDYGLQAIKEGDSIDAVNEKRKQAIELIKQEAIERNRANALDAGAENYKKAIEDAQTELQGALNNAMTQTNLGVFNWVSNNEELQNNSAAISTIISEIVSNNITSIAGKTGEEYQKGLDNIFSQIQDRMRAIGISEKTVTSEWLTDGLFNHQNMIRNYIDEMQKASEAHTTYTDKINMSAEAERKASESSMTLAQKMSALEKSLQKPTDSVHTLYDNIKKLMSQYSNNTIGFNIKIGGEVPKWMSKIGIPELQRLAKQFTSLGATYKNGAYVNGKYMSQQELLQHGADYATAAESMQTKKEDDKAKWDAGAKERKAQAKKNANDAKKHKEELQRLANETAERNAQIAENDRRTAEQVAQGALDIEQARINAMDEGYSREIAQNELNYKRSMQQIEKQKEEMLNAVKDKKILEWQNEHPKATKEDVLNYSKSLNVTDSDLSSAQLAQITSMSKYAKQIWENANKQSLNNMLNDVLSYEQKRTQIAEEYEKKRQQLYETETDSNGNFKSYKTDANGNKILRKGVTQGNVETLNQQENDALVAVDEQFASKSEEYQAWCEAIGTLTLNQLEAVLKDAQKKLNEAQKSGTASEKDLAVARAKVYKAQTAVTKAKAKEDISPKKRAIKDWEDLYKTLSECEKEFESIGDTVGGVAGDIINTAGLILTSTLSMINSIVQLSQMSSTAIKGTATATATAISTVEKASVILTIISAALQIAMTIVNLFNDDKNKQKEIDALQDRIDQLQWELEHQDLMNLRKNDFDALKNVRQIMIDLRLEAINSAKQTGVLWKVIYASIVNVSDQQELLNKGAKELATAYANVAYAADKALGAKKYDNAREQLENIAKQQMIIQEQIDAENGKKKTDDGAIQDWEQKIEELGEDAITIINDLVDDIIGGSASDIVEQLSDAFFEAFQNGKDAAKAWGDKVNEIVADVLKRMMIQKFLEEPLGEIFDRYKKTWFKDGTFQGIQTVINSMYSFSNDLNGLYPMFSEEFQQILDSLPDSLKDYFIGTAEREAQDKGIATASQESVDEFNGRMTTVQGHTYSISENTKLLVQNTRLILQSVMNIESNTDGLSQRMANVEMNVKSVKDTVNEIALNGLKIK